MTSWHAMLRCALLLVTLTAVLLLAAGGEVRLQVDAPSAGAAEPLRVSLPLIRGERPYVDTTLARATYASILAMVEPATGLPHDRFDASLYDLVPQLASLRQIPAVSTGQGASLTAERCTSPECRHSGDYGLQLSYTMPPSSFGSYNLNAHAFDVSRATSLELWAKGQTGDERLEIVLWSDCNAGFPGRPASALLRVEANWTRLRIPLADFAPFANLAQLCRLSIGFNDAIHPGGTIFLDEIAFVDDAGARVPVPLDESTNVTNIGLYMASVLGARALGWESEQSALTKLDRTLASVERFERWRGFPQAHNRVVSLQPDLSDRCISTVDLANFAAGLTVLRNGVPALAARAGALLDAMEWDWLYDQNVGLLYGCRYPDGRASTWHYDWFAADSYTAYTIAVGTGKVPADAWGRLNRARETPRCVGPELWHYEPGWDGGGLFMTLLPMIFLERAREELGQSTNNLILDQICHFRAIGAPAWGQSATALPPYGERYLGYGELNDDILVPHAGVLAAETRPADEVGRNLRAFEALGARRPVTDGAQSTDFGFRSSVNWRTGQVSTVYLVLDQAMAFLTLANSATGGTIRALYGR